jgi:hypothetical protein
MGEGKKTCSMMMIASGGSAAGVLQQNGLYGKVQISTEDQNRLVGVLRNAGFRELVLNPFKPRELIQMGNAVAAGKGVVLRFHLPMAISPQHNRVETWAYLGETKLHRAMAIIGDQVACLELLRKVHMTAAACALLPGHLAQHPGMPQLLPAAALPPSGTVSWVLLPAVARMF